MVIVRLFFGVMHFVAVGVTQEQDAQGIESLLCAECLLHSSLAPLEVSDPCQTALCLEHLHNCVLSLGCKI